MLLLEVEMGVDSRSFVWFWCGNTTCMNHISFPSHDFQAGMPGFHRVNFQEKQWARNLG